jgi:hypothetical protein
MYHGYMLANESFRVRHDAPRQEWRFLAIASMLENDPARLLEHLKIGSQISFKLLCLAPVFKALLIVVGALLGLCALVHYQTLIFFARNALDFLLWVAPALFLIGAGAVLVNNFFDGATWLGHLKKALRNYRRKDDNPLTLAAAGASVIFVVPSVFYVSVIDPIFKKIGRI